MYKRNPKIKLMKESRFKNKSKRTFEDLCGIIKTAKPVDAVKLVNEIRKGE